MRGKERVKKRECVYVFEEGKEEEEEKEKEVRDEREKKKDVWK